MLGYAKDSGSEWEVSANRENVTVLYDSRPIPGERKCEEMPDNRGEYIPHARVSRTVFAVGGSLVPSATCLGSLRVEYEGTGLGKDMDLVKVRRQPGRASRMHCRIIEYITKFKRSCGTKVGHSSRASARE